MNRVRWIRTLIAAALGANLLTVGARAGATHEDGPPIIKEKISLTPTTGPPGTAITATFRGEGCDGADSSFIRLFGRDVYVSYLGKGSIVDGTVTLTFPAPEAEPGTVFVGGHCSYLDQVYPPPDDATFAITARRVAEPVVTTSRQGTAGWSVSAAGRVTPTMGTASPGDVADVALNAPVVGIATTPSGAGYWIAAADGGVFAFGDARFLGSAGGLPLRAPVVGVAASPTGRGYSLVAADGGVFAYGDAAFRGSVGGMPIAQPVTGMATTLTGAGYWLTAADGGVFAFGDAPFRGSVAGARLAAPVVALAPTTSGYRLLGADGGVFSFNAPFAGAPAGLARFIGITTTPAGYLLDQPNATARSFP